MLKFLLFNVPSRVGTAGYFWPLGLIYVASIINRSGHEVKIVDLYDDINNTFLPVDLDFVYQAVRNYNPDVIGYGGIASSYTNTKKYALAIREKFPKIIQIAGGALSSVYELLLKNVKLDFVFHGEVEVTLPQWIESIINGDGIDKIQGISFIHDGKIIRKPPAPQIENLDDIPFPDYNVIDQPSKYFEYADHHFTIAERIFDYRGRLPQKTLELIKSNPAFMTLTTARGCSHACSFCYRHFKGIRKHSVGYVIEHIKRLKNQFNVGGFRFGDEFFNISKKWVNDFCDALEEGKLDIFYKISGARVSQVDKATLMRLRETGCFDIDYGYESGSDKILKELGKGVTRAQNIQAAKDALEVGVSSPVQLVIGSPGEDDTTIQETIAMLKEIKAYDYSLNYLMALPETPIWKYCQENNLIPDIEKHLSEVASLGGFYYVNLTKLPYLKVMGWRLKIRSETEAEYFRNKGNLFMFFLHKIFSNLYSSIWFIYFREKIRLIYKALRLNKIRVKFIKLKDNAYSYKKKRP